MKSAVSAGAALSMKKAVNLPLTSALNWYEALCPVLSVRCSTRWVTPATGSVSSNRPTRNTSAAAFRPVADADRRTVTPSTTPVSTTGIMARGATQIPGPPR